MMETLDTVFVLFLIVGLVVTLYCGAMWILLSIQRRKDFEEFFRSVRDGEDK